MKQYISTMSVKCRSRGMGGGFPTDPTCAPIHAPMTDDYKQAYLGRAVSFPAAIVKRKGGIVGACGRKAEPKVKAAPVVVAPAPEAPPERSPAQAAHFARLCALATPIPARTFHK